MKKPAIDSAPASCILLVDDNEHGLIARRKVLEEQGYRIETAFSGEEAMEMLTARRFDLIVTDFKMTGMTGVELIAKIRLLDASIPLVLLSGFVEPLGMTEESTGADAVLAKSAGEAGHLVRTARRLLEGGVRKPLKAEKGRTRNFLAKSV